MKLRPKPRKGYFFGYGADQEEDMIFAITGKKPKAVGRAILPGYELRIQKLSEITTAGPNPQRLLRKQWGDWFKSYVIVANPDAQVSGMIFKLTVKARNKVDNWELVQLGWYEKKFVTVEMVGTRKKLVAETQVLKSTQQASIVFKTRYRPWLMPKKKFLTRARRERHN